MYTKFDDISCNHSGEMIVAPKFKRITSRPMVIKPFLLLELPAEYRSQWWV